ncbi:MAG: epoxyqueuosine reductase [Clostridiales Family XIII bacterium]|jgi:epoxyqueuosine reductase|nr:epoxyqueuosine reductase [Clostridiales Family XIII bacterium]
MLQRNGGGLSLVSKIERKAQALNIDKCGIIRPEAMSDYADRLRERMGRIPNGEAVYGGFLRFADIREKFPWAKSIVVIALSYGHYALPANAAHYGKYYLIDSRFNPDSPERKKITAFENFLGELGLKTASSVHPGITAMRWAAHKAGLGLIRRNNFLYTEKGSWVSLTAWATDAEMELISDGSALPPCPDDCDRCIRACPTKSLFAPYTMNMATCVSRLSTLSAPAAYDEETGRRMGTRIYGCDACQDVCPMNKGKWTGEREFPGLRELGGLLSPENILSLPYAEIERILAPKFFYIKKDALWMWKLNAINVLANAGAPAGIERIAAMLCDEHEIVRERAKRALDRLRASERTRAAEAED